jgi:hypothetical protein
MVSARAPSHLKKRSNSGLNTKTAVHEFCRGTCGADVLRGYLNGDLCFNTLAVTVVMYLFIF